MRRFHCETALWHVFARGARRLTLFRDEQDFLQFLRYLTYALSRSGCRLWGYVLMTNHYHLMLEGSSKQLTACMRRLGSMYSVYHNKRYGLDGHTFDGPYQAFRQASRYLALHCLAYIHFNPVKGGLCPRPEDYPWSSCRCYLGLPGSPLSINPTGLLTSVGPSLSIAWARFHEAMACEDRRPARPTFGKLSMKEVHLQQFEWILQQAKADAGDLMGEDPAIVAMYRARRVGISAKAIAIGLGLESSRPISNQLYRFNERLDQDPALKARVDRF